MNKGLRLRGFEDDIEWVECHSHYSYQYHYTGDLFPSSDRSLAAYVTV
jgi:hypothetical protein